MEYPFIDIKSIFVYKALPIAMNDRVKKLPARAHLSLPTATGFAIIDQAATQAAFRHIDWANIAERNLTQCALIDTFAALVHEQGCKPLNVYVKAMGNRYNSEVLGHAIRALMGISASQFVMQYTMMMIRDLQDRTDLQGKEIASLLHFTGSQTFSQFIRTHSRL